MKTYITADPHFSKAGSNVLSRPFSDAREMSEHILDAINAKIGTKYARLIILGDFSPREPEYWRQRLITKNCVLILGNHCHRNKSIRAFGHMNVRETWDTKLCGHPCWMSHYAHCVWPKSHYGSFHLYGHTHGMREETLDTLFPGRRSMDAGVDEAFRILGEWTCFDEQEIYDILSTRPGWDNVDFYKQLRGERHSPNSPPVLQGPPNELG